MTTINSWTPDSDDTVYQDSYWTMLHANDGTYIDNGLAVTDTASTTVNVASGDFFIEGTTYNYGGGSLNLNTPLTQPTSTNRRLVILWINSSSVLQVYDGVDVTSDAELRVEDLLYAISGIDGCMLARIRYSSGNIIAGDIHDSCRTEKNTYSVAQGGTALTSVGTSEQVLRTNTGATAFEHHSLVKADVGLGNVDNIADASQTTLGTIGTGVWEGTAIADGFIASASTWNAKYGSGSSPTFGDITMSNANPRIYIQETGATPDNLRWDIYANAEVLYFRAGNDADSTNTAFMTVQRTGTTIDSVILDGRDIGVDGGKLDAIEPSATADQTLGDINGLGITTLGTVGTGVWNASVIASARLDSDTAHLTTTQTFSGAKTFSSTSCSYKGSFTGNAIANSYLSTDTAHLTTTQTFSGAKTFSSSSQTNFTGSVLTKNDFIIEDDNDLLSWGDDSTSGIMISQTLTDARVSFDAGHGGNSLWVDEDGFDATFGANSSTIALDSSYFNSAYDSNGSLGDASGYSGFMDRAIKEEEVGQKLHIGFNFRDIGLDIDNNAKLIFNLIKKVVKLEQKIERLEHVKIINTI